MVEEVPAAADGKDAGTGEAIADAFGAAIAVAAGGAAVEEDAEGITAATASCGNR
jgi:hypothetical protein